jgi:hypothetical protein
MGDPKEEKVESFIRPEVLEHIKENTIMFERLLEKNKYEQFLERVFMWVFNNRGEEEANEFFTACESFIKTTQKTTRSGLLRVFLITEHNGNIEAMIEATAAGESEHKEFDLQELATLKAELESDPTLLDRIKEAIKPYVDFGDVAAYIG